MGTIDWEHLAQHTYPLVNKVPPLNFMLGTFKLDPPPTPEKPKSQRAKKAPETTKMIAQTIEKSDQPVENKEGLHAHILRALWDHYKKNGKQPINYFQFVLDPKNFNQSVLNAFHFAFLVRDELVNLFLNDKGIPVVVPLNPKKMKGADQQKRVQKRQFFNILTPVEYEKLVKVFEVTECAIPPFPSSRS